MFIVTRGCEQVERSQSFGVPPCIIDDVVLASQTLSSLLIYFYSMKSDQELRRTRSRRWPDRSNNHSIDHSKTQVNQRIKHSSDLGFFRLCPSLTSFFAPHVPPFLPFFSSTLYFLWFLFESFHFSKSIIYVYI